MLQNNQVGVCDQHKKSILQKVRVALGKAWLKLGALLEKPVPYISQLMVLLVNFHVTHLETHSQFSVAAVSCFLVAPVSEKASLHSSRSM